MWISFPLDMGGQITVFLTGDTSRGVSRWWHIFECLRSCSRDLIYLLNTMPKEYLLGQQVICGTFWNPLSVFVSVSPAALCSLQQSDEPPGGSRRLQSAGQSLRLSGQLCCQTQAGPETQSLQQEETCQCKTTLTPAHTPNTYPLKDHFTLLQPGFYLNSFGHCFNRLL